jgi:hypothetical protein
MEVLSLRLFFQLFEDILPLWKELDIKEFTSVRCREQGRGVGLGQATAVGKAT